MYCSSAVFSSSAAHMSSMHVDKDRHSAVQSRGAPLRGIHATPTLSAHEARLRQGQWQHAQATDMGTVYAKHLDPVDKRRYVIAAKDSTQGINCPCRGSARLLALCADELIIVCDRTKRFTAGCLQD